MNTLVLHGAHVATVDPTGTEYGSGHVVVTDGIITAVGDGPAQAGLPDARYVDASGCLITPGFVNTHHHLYQTLTRAVPAAVAARCAGAQGRYWEYHDLLFLAQPDFSREDLLGYARRLGLDVDAFTQCFDTARFQDAVLADQREGREAGVRATPTFFINGRKIEGALPIETFREAVQQALRQAR